MRRWRIDDFNNACHCPLKTGLFDQKLWRAVLTGLWNPTSLKSPLWLGYLTRQELWNSTFQAIDELVYSYRMDSSMLAAVVDDPEIQITAFETTLKQIWWDGFENWHSYGRFKSTNYLFIIHGFWYFHIRHQKTGKSSRRYQADQG